MSSEKPAHGHSTIGKTEDRGGCVSGIHIVCLVWQIHRGIQRSTNYASVGVRLECPYGTLVGAVGSDNRCVGGPLQLSNSQLPLGLVVDLHMGGRVGGEPRWYRHHRLDARPWISTSLGNGIGACFGGDHGLSRISPRSLWSESMESHKPVGTRRFRLNSYIKMLKRRASHR